VTLALLTSTMQPDLPSHPSVPAIPGLGPQSQRMLQTAGITSLSQLRALGAVRAYVRVKRAGCHCSLNLTSS
jgi:DNA transformation protein